MRLPDSERAREELRRLSQHPHARYWGLAIGVIFVVIAILVILLSVQDTSPVDQFLTRWKEVMESQDEEAYAALWDEDARKDREQDFETARNMVASKRLQVHLEGIRPVADPVDPKAYIVRQIPVTFDRDGESVTTHHTIRVARRGWRRHWKLIAHTVRSPEPEAPVLAQKPQEEKTPSQEAEEAPLEAFQLPASGDAPLDTQLKLSQILEAWRTAWEQKNLDEYLSWYADEADITRVTVIKGKEYPRKLRKYQLRRHMERLNRKYSRIQVKLSNLEISGDEAVADVSFLQEYAAWSNRPGKKLAYRDIGTKRLKFMIDPSDGNWKIYQETWKIYRDVPYKL